MEHFIWAFGTTLFVIVLIYFLPLGLTKIGKILVALTGFLLALAGLAAISTFPMWQTLLILFLLILLITYLADKRFGTWLYTQSASLDEEWSGEDPLSLQPEESRTTMDFHKDTAVEVERIFALSSAEKEEDTYLLRPIELEEKSDEAPLLPDSIDEDISFIFNRNLENEQESEKESIEIEKGYLSEIEKLLSDHTDEIKNPSEEISPTNQTILSDEENAISILSFNEKSSIKREEAEMKSIPPSDGLEELPILSFHENGGTKE